MGPVVTRLSPRDRAALAYECLRLNRHFIRDRLEMAEAALRLGGVTSRNITRGMEGYTSRTQPWSVTYCRLALLLRAALRADRGDVGPMRWVGCSCSCDGDNGGWLPRPFVPLWAAEKGPGA